MPGWHDATAALRDAGKLAMVGIVEEQHPDRARLFMQWKRMEWPLLVDSLNLLDLGVVPITLLVDEHGIVRHAVPGASRAGETLRDFLATRYPAPDRVVVAPPSPDLDALTRAVDDEATAGTWRALADGLALWGGRPRLDDAIAAYGLAIELDPGDARAEFRRGVLHRRRYDVAGGSPADFGRAVAHWTRALELDPNNYIWRRRIQQYGPRLDKPYPFYDWVARARAEIVARGQTPVDLTAEPRGAELAAPLSDFAAAAGEAGDPDREGRILRDEGRLVRIHATVVPPSIAPGETGRIHFELRPNAATDAHWNNEGGGLLVRIDPPPGWSTSQRVIEVAPAPTAVSDEPRHVEVEVQSSPGASGRGTLSGHALYYVCEGAHGSCLYRRQDLSVELLVADPPSAR